VTEPVAAALSPVGIVKTPGVDDKLDKIYEALDAQEFRNEFLEGKELSGGEVRRRTELLKTITREVNLRLAGRVTVLGCWPELMGRGARFKGTDAEGREYTIDFHVGAEDRMSHSPDDRERDVRETVGMIVEAVLGKRAEYLARGGLDG
jgi:hypothetical protein